MMATSGPPRLKARNEVVVIRVFPIMVNLTSLDRLAKETSGGSRWGYANAIHPVVGSSGFLVQEGNAP